MSAEAVSGFIAKVREDSALLAELKAIDTSDKDTALGKLVEIASSKGYEFTVDDYKTSIEQELSDDELENVAGGSYYPSLNWV